MAKETNIERANFEAIASTTKESQDKQAEIWAERIVSCIEEAAESGFDTIYLHQITSLGFVPSMKRLFISRVTSQDIPYPLINLIDDWDAVCELVGVSVLDDAPISVINQAADIAGCKISSSERIEWGKRLSEIRGEEALPF